MSFGAKIVKSGKRNKEENVRKRRKTKHKLKTWYNKRKKSEIKPKKGA